MNESELGLVFTWRTHSVKQMTNQHFGLMWLPHSPTLTCSMSQSCGQKVPLVPEKWFQPACLCIFRETVGGGEGKDPFKHYLSDVFLLLFFEGKFNEDLLQLLITVVDNELLKAVVLSDETCLNLLCVNSLGPSWSELLQQLQVSKPLY